MDELDKLYELDECPVSNINSLDMLFFYELDENLVNQEESLEELARYGNNKEEIVNYFSGHILMCGLCKEMYSDFVQINEFFKYEIT